MDKKRAQTIILSVEELLDYMESHENLCPHAAAVCRDIRFAIAFPTVDEHNAEKKRLQSEALQRIVDDGASRKKGPVQAVSRGERVAQEEREGRAALAAFVLDKRPITPDRPWPE